MHIGVISDTHIIRDTDNVPHEVFEVFSKVDMILHCGDIFLLSVLNRLETLCPVVAVPGYGDSRLESRICDVTRVVNAEGVHIGLIHDINWPGPRLLGVNETLEFPPEPLTAVLTRKFGSSVDVVVFGDTHNPLITTQEGVLFINPGAVLCKEGRDQTANLGTVAIVSIHQRKASAEIIPISRNR